MNALHYSIAVQELVARVRRDMQDAYYYKDMQLLMAAADSLACVLTNTLQQLHYIQAEPLYYAAAIQDLLERMDRRMQNAWYYKDKHLLIAAAKSLAISLTSMIRQHPQRSSSGPAKRSD